MILRLLERILAWIRNYADIAYYGSGPDDRGEICERDSKIRDSMRKTDSEGKQ